MRLESRVEWRVGRNFEVLEGGFGLGDEHVRNGHLFRVNCIQGEPKARNIRAWGKSHAELGTVFLVTVIDGKTLAQFGRGSSDDVINIGIVGRLSTKHLDTDGALLDLAGRTIEGLLHHVTQKGDRSSTGSKGLIAHQEVELSADHLRSQANSKSVVDFEINHGDVQCQRF